MEPTADTSAILTGVAANALYGLAVKLAQAILTKKTGKPTPPEHLRGLLALPRTQVGRQVMEAGTANGAKLAALLASDEVEALFRDMFSTRATQPGAASTEMIRAQFRALHADALGSTATREEADALFQRVTTITEDYLAAAVDRGVLAAHDANEAQRFKALKEEMAREFAAVKRLLQAHPLGASTADLSTPAAELGVVMPAGTLAVGLSRTAGDDIRVHYWLKGASPLPRTLGAATTKALLRAIDADPARAGEPLFQLLFGTPTDTANPFAQLFEDAGHPADCPIPRPERLRVDPRLRIVTDDPALLNLPWSRLRWRDGQRLIDYGWEIVTAAAPVPEHRCRTGPKAELLVITDAPAAKTGRRSSLTARLDALRPAKADTVREVADARALTNALAGMHLHAVFIELACADSDGHALRLPGPDGSDALPVAELEQALLACTDALCLVVMALRGDAAAGVMARLTRRLGGDVPLLLQVAPDATGTASDALLALLGDWLGNGDDPVRALHRQLRERRADQAPGAELIRIHAGYRDWQTEPQGRRQVAGLTHLALDRDAQKAMVTEHLRKLAGEDRVRVLFIVAYGSRENLVGALSRQLAQQVQVALARTVALTPLSIGVPEVLSPADPYDPDADSERLLAKCRPHLESTLGRDDGETLKQLFRRHGTKGLRRGQTGVLWLDWGHIDTAAPDGDRLAEAALSALPRFAAETLNDHCPEGRRLACILTVQLEEDAYDWLTGTLQDLEDQDWHDRDGFRLLPLEPLGQVDRAHLRDYLTADRTGLDERSRRDLVRLIHADTGGDFDKTVARLEQGERTGWPELLRKLEAGNRKTKQRKRRAFPS